MSTQVPGRHKLGEMDLRGMTRIEPNHILAMVNRFVVYTTCSLHKFSLDCEARLLTLHQRIAALDMDLILLETKLTSITYMNEFRPSVSAPRSHTESKFSEAPTPPPAPPVTPVGGVPVTMAPTAPPLIVDVKTMIDNQPAAELAAIEAVPVPGDIPIKEDPRYSRFFKLLKVGANAAQLKTDMRASGLDPSLLE
jgi:WASH complex subunit CCDC53